VTPDGGKGVPDTQMGEVVRGTQSERPGRKRVLPRELEDSTRKQTEEEVLLQYGPCCPRFRGLLALLRGEKGKRGGLTFGRRVSKVPSGKPVSTRKPRQRGTREKPTYHR